MIVDLYRPSPQLSKPSPAAALRCYESSAHNINLGGRQVRNHTIDITWVFLLTIFMSLNTILWSVSYPEVREKHSRDETEELINTSLDVIDQCSERWPGASAASQLYSIFAKACLQSYETFENQQHQPPQQAQQAQPNFLATQYGGPETGSHSPSSDVDPSSPSPASAPPIQVLSSGEITQQQQAQQTPIFNSPQFGYLFENSGELSHQAPFTYDEGPNAGQPQFRSGSIFLNPASTEPIGRRFSYFPPEGPPPMNSSDSSLQDEETPRTSTDSSQTTGVIDFSPSIVTSPEAFISPPNSNNFISMSPATTITTASSPTPTPTMSQINTLPVDMGFSQSVPLIKPVKFESPTRTPQIQQMQPFQWPSTQPIVPIKPIQRPQQQQQQPKKRQQRQQQQQQQQQQKPLPPPIERSQQPAMTASDWFPTQEPFLSPYTFRSITGTGTGGYMSDPATAFTGYGLGGFGGLSNPLTPLTGNFGAGLAGIGGGPGSLSDSSLDFLSGGQADFNTAGTGGRPGVMDGLTMADAFGFGSGLPLNPQRQGSLSQEQQMELMDVLETEGMSDIDQFLTMGTGLTGIKSEEADGLNW